MIVKRLPQNFGEDLEDLKKNEVTIGINWGYLGNSQSPYEIILKQLNML